MKPVFLSCVFFVFLEYGVTMKEAAVRNSVKIVLLNRENKVLLMSTDDKGIKGSDGIYNGRFWQLIGGSVENDETLDQTIKRELFEETSIADKDVKFGPVIWRGELDLIMHDKQTHIIQQFVFARTNQRSFSLDNLTMEEKTTVRELRWFSMEDIENSKEIIYPVVLPRYLKPLIEGNIPEEPITIDLTKTK
jgi:ADP-ribose pyrophosphatase YjhB (NUDIX family)